MASQIISAPSKYRDIIQKSVLVRPGSPTVYQLRPKKECMGSLKRVTLGEPAVNRINKTILLVGETGTGKSTLINVLVNHVLGVQWEDDVWFEIVEKEDERQPEQVESQTTDVIVYQIFSHEDPTRPSSLTIIDTPGYGDTGGIQKDAIVSKRLLDWFRSDDGIHELNAVALVLKASENRLNPRVRYIFDSVVSLFGKNMKKNIVPLMTHSDGAEPENALTALRTANIQISQNQRAEPRYFMFNNRQSRQKTTRETFVLKFAWDFTAQQMNEFMDFLKETSPQKLNTTVDVLNERNRLTACMVNLRQRVRYIELQLQQIQKEKEILKDCQDNMETNKNYTKTVPEVYKEKEKIEGGRWGFLWLYYKGAMNCLECKETCHHEGCIYATSPDDRSCVVFKDGKCTVCTNKCSTKVHVKDTWIYVTKTRNVQKTDQDIKRKFEESKAASEVKLSALEKLEKTLRELQAQKDRVLDESFQHLVTLEKIALNVDSLSTVMHLDFLLEKMRDKGDHEKVRKLEEMSGRVDQGTRAAARYMKSGMEDGEQTPA